MNTDQQQKSTVCTSPEGLVNRWELLDVFGIVWNISGNLPHQDHLEMSGRRVSVIVTYGVGTDGSVSIDRHVVWPMLRTVPNDTHASLSRDFGSEIEPKIFIDGHAVEDRAVRIIFDGLLTVESVDPRGLRIKRTLFPSTTYPIVIERWELTNESGSSLEVAIEPLRREERTEADAGVDGVYVLTAASDATECSRTLEAGKTLSFDVSICGCRDNDALLSFDVAREEEKRRAFVRELNASLRLETPDPILNRAFDFSKLRAAESIFETKGGLMHSPGGGPYYAALWCNDQAEYSGPFFPFLGCAAGNEASLNCYRWFARYMGTDYKAIPSSIIAEGTGIWAGAGDRGDAAMYAYGAAKFALALGDRAVAEELWTPILWALEYCQQQMTSEGVIASDSDELEGRFPCGKANLSTSSLTYGALRSAINLARALGKPESVAQDFDARADALERSIERYFGASIDGYDTYRYFDGDTELRSWICLPPAMGIMGRKTGTLNALFSPRLWTVDGLATQADGKTFWDRSTLYGLRSAFAAGDTERALKHLSSYTCRRLLGEHVPYPVEAYPEGSQRHLSAESALYCSVYIDGLFGIMPTSLDRFNCTPHLPTEWQKMALRSVKAFGHTFDVIVERNNDAQLVEVFVQNVTSSSEGDRTSVFSQTCELGDTICVVLPAAELLG